MDGRLQPVASPTGARKIVRSGPLIPWAVAVAFVATGSRIFWLPFLGATTVDFVDWLGQVLSLAYADIIVAFAMTAVCQVIGALWRPDRHLPRICRALCGLFLACHAACIAAGAWFKGQENSDAGLATTFLSLASELFASDRFASDLDAHELLCLAICMAAALVAVGAAPALARRFATRSAASSLETVSAFQ